MKARPFKPGEQHYHWTLLREVPATKSHRCAEARCACGAVKVVNLASVRCGQSRSCKKCSGAMSSRKHGRWNTPEYSIWSGIKQRCYNAKGTAFYNYGGRGIRVCDRWKDSFENFLADIGPRPSPEHSVDRRDNDGDYTPENCFWATLAEQARNKRATKWQRVLLLLVGTGAAEVQAMVTSHVPDEEIARHIAATFHPRKARCA